ncbi:MAG: DJ-1/PfpI family protein [Firmicutes bacterium]|nr:DJ-1/PfpI family protein [Bacillota bacterium]
MKKTVLFVILDQYADWKAAYLSSWILALGQDRYAVQTVSLSKEPIRSMGGFTVLPDYDIPSAPTDFEGLILVGGMSWRNENALQVIPLVQNALENQRVLGAICDASAFLGKIGALNHADHTSNALDDVKQWAGEAYTGESRYRMQQAVRDKKIITANGTASLEFAREVMLALEIAPEDKILEQYHFDKFGFYGASMPGM